MRNLKTIVAVACLAGSVVIGQAQTLNLSGTLENSLVDQELIGAFPLSDVGATNGTISSWVVNDTALDPHGYTFIYQVVNSGVDAIDQVELTGLPVSVVTGTATYASLTGSLPLSGSLTPSSGGNFAIQGLFNTDVNFEGGDLNNGGTASYFLVITTDTTGFTGSYGQIQDDFTAAGAILAPVPEPSAPLIMLAGFASLFVAFKFRGVARAKAS